MIKFKAVVPTLSLKYRHTYKETLVVNPLISKYRRLLKKQKVTYKEVWGDDNFLTFESI